MGSPEETASERRPIERLSLTDQVRNILLEDLTSGRLRPGDRINEAKLARALGISRNPIREAISGLAQRGFLIAVPRRGHFMRRFTLDDVNDFFSFRICVESFAVRQALPKLTDSDRNALKALFERMMQAAKAGHLTRLRQADLALHRRLCELSRNRQTVRAHEGIDAEMQMLIASVGIEQESPLETAMGHVPLIEAILKGDVDEAVAAMERHLKETWYNVLQRYEETGQNSEVPRRGVRGARTAA